MTRSANRVLGLLVTSGLLFVPASSLAQRCVDPLDSADNPTDHRYCGAPLIDLALGPAGFGDHTLPGATDGCLHLNDDGSSPNLNILPYFPGGLRFFSTTHNSLFLNTNGNITFSAPLVDFTPDPFPVARQPMIAPFWSDVDNRNADCATTPAGTCVSRASNQVWWHFEPGRAYFTWDEVGYFACHDADRRNSFQMILSSAEGCGGPAGGDFDVEFRYNRCEWDTGDIDGANGFSDFPTDGAAQAGFDAGDEMNFVEIPTSRATRTIIRTLCEESNVGTPGVWRFTIRAGMVICPDAGDECTVTDSAGAPLVGACAEGRTNCVGGGTECVPQITPRAEICDNIDNDCNGMVDDGMDSDLCFSSAQTCLAGVCVDNCFEGSCGEGLTCNAADICVDPSCDGVVCGENERCAGGDCVPACEGIVCPAPTSCVAGRCIDACAGLDCDDCTVCDGGSCVARCTATGPLACGLGEECAPDGRCISAGCSDVTCAPGTICRSGGCVDACLDAICPPGDVCVAGMCMRRERPDAGPPVDVGMRDTGVPGDTGPDPTMDAGPFDAGADASREPPPGPRVCGCRVPVSDGAGHPVALGLLGLLGAVLTLRRRR
jgi:hypothetical protein